MASSVKNKDKSTYGEPMEKLLQMRKQLQQLETESTRIQKVIDKNSKQYHDLLDLYPAVSAYEQASEIVKGLQEKWPIKLSDFTSEFFDKFLSINIKLLSLFPKLKRLYDRALKNLNAAYDALLSYLEMLDADDVEEAVAKYYAKMQKALVIYLQMNEELSRQLSNVKKDVKEVSSRIQILTRAFPYISVLGSMPPEMIAKLPQKALSSAFESLKALTDQQNVTIESTDDIASLKVKWTKALGDCKEAVDNLKVIQCKYDVIVNGQLSASFKRWESYLKELCSAVEPNRRRAALVAGNMKKLFMDCTRREELLIKHKHALEALSGEQNKFKALEGAISDLKVIEKAFKEEKMAQLSKTETPIVIEKKEIKIEKPKEIHKTIEKPKDKNYNRPVVIEKKEPQLLPKGGQLLGF